MPEGSPVELLRGLAVMAEPPGAGQAAIAEALDLPGAPTAAEYSDVFLFQLYPYASVHLGVEGMLGGESRERVAGFWRALGLTPPAEPDHLAALVGLYASLSERVVCTDDDAERLLVDRARGALLTEHLTPWVFAYLDRVEELSGVIYARWASLLSEVLYSEIGARARRLGVEAAPGDASAHLRDMPSVPDPRLEPSGEFMDALLAPARSGVVLTRADLARIAGALDLGLRAGERRYALEHLLAQDAEGVLRALATESGRQAERHRSRRDRIPNVAAFFEARAGATAGLLRALASEVSASV